MCGGGAGSAQKEADAAEAARRAQVTQTQQAIEQAYGSPQRSADINDLIGATRTFLGQDLSRRNAVAGRELKFANARSGQSLGSLSVDRNRQLGQEYLRGALEVERRAQGAGSQLRDADQQAKLGLFNQAAAGLDMTTAVRNAGEAMRAQAGIQRADALQSGLGGLFDSFGDIYKNSRADKGARDAEKYQYNTTYTPNQFFSAATNYGGQGYTGKNASW